MRASRRLAAAAIAALLVAPSSVAIAQRPSRSERQWWPRYSTVPAPTNVDLSVSVLAQVLPGLVFPKRAIALVVGPDRPELGPTFTSVRNQMPSYWPDSLRREVENALADPALEQSASLEQVEPLVRQLGMRMVPYSPDLRISSDTSPVILSLSRPGFNHDSTIAAVRADVDCGAVCGSGQVILLSRRPGFRWLIWIAFSLWIS
jgi:hypothetical protein